MAEDPIAALSVPEEGPNGSLVTLAVNLQKPKEFPPEQEQWRATIERPIPSNLI
jgi:hypothetical protein